MQGSSNFQGVMPFSPMVKRLVIINVAIWLVGIIIIQRFLLGEYYLFDWFGMVPSFVVNRFWVWQPFTYMFLHSEAPFHILFNMLILWMFGSELERHWGARNFLYFYLASGLGAGIIYTVLATIYFLISGNGLLMSVPVVGASGAGFGLMLAYGILFGERVIYFMMLFPMKAKWFVAILAGVEVISLLNDGGRSGVANLAHLGGLVAGWVYLTVWTKRKQRGVRKSTKKHGRKLKLVVDNERQIDDKNDGPKYWN